jgi:predicted O-methyltransferase YrrM
VSQELWTSVDRYLEGQLIPPDEARDAALRASAAAGLPEIAVTPSQGKLLYLLAKMQRARRILEIGTLGGYSTIWMARALAQGGRLITLEAEARRWRRCRKSPRKRGGLSISSSSMRTRKTPQGILTGPCDCRGLALRLWSTM